MKIIELLTLFNEIELLKVHIEEHWDYVDKFVISEAAHTYAKRPKPFNFEANIEQFKPYMDKIQYMKLDMSDSLFWTDCRANQNIQQYWPLLVHPEYMREYDYCLHNDLDEIIDSRHWPRFLERVKAEDYPKHVKCNLRHFRNYLNWEFPSFDYEVFRFSKLEGDAKFLVPYKPDFSLFNDGTYGYHFTFMGGVDKAKYKLENFMHWRNVNKEALDTLKPDQYSFYYRDDVYGSPKVHANPKEEMPKAIQDNWEFFKTWVAPNSPIHLPKNAPAKVVKR